MRAVSDRSPEPVVLWQFDACWGQPSASPFCVKLETWLRMVGVPHRVEIVRGPPRSPNRKAPYVELPGGRIIADSGVVIDQLGAELGCSLDEGLDPAQQATVTAFTRLLEDHFYWAIVWDRWIIPEHWPHTRRAYFGGLPWPVRRLVPALIRRGMVRVFDGQGFGRMPEARIEARIEQDLDALEAQIGDGEHVLDRPSRLDATAHGFVLGALRTPFDGPLRRAVERRASLVRFCERVEARWWPEGVGAG